MNPLEGTINPALKSFLRKALNKFGFRDFREDRLKVPAPGMSTGKPD